MGGGKTGRRWRAAAEGCEVETQQVGSSDLSAIWERRKQPAPKGFLSLSQRENLQAC